MSKTATREAYGNALVKLGEINKNIVVLDADLSKSTKTGVFLEKFPERFFNMGIAEQNMVGTAVGFAIRKKIPFVSSFAIFAAGRAFEQIRNSVAYSKMNVKIAATHAGITVGEDGASHQSIEDISLMRSIPNMVVIVPADGPETELAMEKIVEYNGPVYLRLGRSKVPDIDQSKTEFKIGKARVLKEGKDIFFIATGMMVDKALKVSEILKEKYDIGVMNIHTIKPLDKEAILKAAKNSKLVVTLEEHSIIGGLGSAVAEVLTEDYPTRLLRIGINDEFGQSGKSEELVKYYKLDEDGVIFTLDEFIKNKGLFK